jgi:hypothetical protein
MGRRTCAGQLPSRENAGDLPSVLGIARLWGETMSTTETGQYYTLAGVRVGVANAWGQTWLDVPCLGGEDVCRCNDTLSVVIEAGRAFWPSTGAEFVAQPSDSPIRGWGQIDADEAYDVHPEGCAWFVSVGRELWDALADKFAFRLRVCVSC